MNLSEGIGASTNGTWIGGGDVVADQFPAGLRVLVVDDDPICLRVLEKMLLTCLYKVTKCNRAEIALSLLRQDRNGFDIVISDVHMPDMDGFKLLEHICLEMDLPVIVMSVDDGKNVVMKGVTHGACDYLIKPVRIEALKNIWQHVVRKKKNEQKDLEQSGSVEDCHMLLKPSDDLDYASSANEESWKNFKKRNEEEEEAEDREDSTLKKPLVVWSVELHQQFVAAVHQIGIDKAVPKKILELMNVQGLTRENVASHLQKYRLYLTRVSGASKHQNGLGNSFMTSQEATFGPVPSLYEIDFQALAASGQLPAQSLATLQAATQGRSSSPFVEQRNLLSFENPKLRFREVQPPQQQQHTNSKQVNLLHGIPTTLEMKQLAANFHPSVQSFQSTNMQVNAHQRQSTHLPMQITQQQSRPGQLNDQFSKQSVPQPILSNIIINQGVLEKNGILKNGRVRFNTVSQTSPVVNFSMTQNAPAAKGVFQVDGNLDMKQPIGFVPSYDIFNEMHQKKTHDWDSHDVGLTFKASRHTNSGFLADHEKNRNVVSVAKTMFSPGKRSEHHNVQNINELMDPFAVQNSIKIKAERTPTPNYETPFFQEDFGQEDLMSALLKQAYSFYKSWLFCWDTCPYM